ncbi:MULTISPECIES: Lsr2 family protein [unclassified Rhodococcus (in: high G+C Gram-positive bacteria)]|uniref:histone-like nucleoid-structuring protein Lsr2 n=1 Tax=unclassified Rhodococcus (in: high G+C Gram-positive bacteria) TaxID=192944 RepID=UPI0023E1C6C3|nr:MULTISPECIES: Lsr2 family protein [unclassified Rhodococcus (in: high G+C Gram-positive bacteria)]MDF3319803.1 Lsr2 family protein [Rhodococcus sp. C3V]MDI9966732.1 Lsr2 family protein [Rhodococcus sp. IEGM 1251]MDV8129090.1 Lsr2 family protein [Rhodococcus sp. IEGM 1304]
MAEILIRQLVDDLDGKPIDTGLGRQVTFSYQGADYRIDLRPANADKIEAAFAPFIKSAERVSAGGKVRTTTSTARKASGSGRSAEQLQAIREWAGKNGFDVSPRGRIKADVVDAFDAAHRSLVSGIFSH